MKNQPLKQTRLAMFLKWLRDKFELPERIFEDLIFKRLGQHNVRFIAPNYSRRVRINVYQRTVHAYAALWVEPPDSFHEGCSVAIRKPVIQESRVKLELSSKFRDYSDGFSKVVCPRKLGRNAEALHQRYCYLRDRIVVFQKKHLFHFSSSQPWFSQLRLSAA